MTPSFHQPVVSVFREWLAHFVNAPSVGFHFLNEHSFEKHSKRLHPQIYQHSDAFRYEIKKYTSCAIHVHSGNSNNPVNCEKSTGNTADWPSFWFGMGPALILRFDILAENVKKKKKREGEQNTFSVALIFLTSRTSCSLEMCDCSHWHRCTDVRIWLLYLETGSGPQPPLKPDNCTVAGADCVLFVYKEYVLY